MIYSPEIGHAGVTWMREDAVGEIISMKPKSPDRASILTWGEHLFCL